jgi:hypothetical protein
MRYLACLVLVFWVAAVSALFLAGFTTDDMRPLARAYGAARPWLFALPAWLALPLGRLAKLVGVSLLAALMTRAAWEPAHSPNLPLLILLGLPMIAAIVQRLAGPTRSGLRSRS